MGLKGQSRMGGIKVLIPHKAGWHKTLYGGAAMYVGVDYHKKYSIATKMDEKGSILEQVRLRNDPETLISMQKPYQRAVR